MNAELLKLSNQIADILKKSNHAVAVSESSAGPTGNRYGDPAGHSAIAISGPVEESVTISTNNSDRELNMIEFTKKTFEEFISVISD